MAAGSSSGGTEGIKAGRAYVEVGINDAGLKAGLLAAKRAVLKLGKEITEAGGVGLGLGAAITGPILESLREVVEHFSEINRAAIRTGATTEAISDLGYAAKASGAELGDVERGLKFLQHNLKAAELGSDQAKEAFAELGLTVEDLKGKDANEQFLMIAQGLDRVEESAKGPALEAILGRKARGLRPMLEDSEELARLLEENGKVGGRVSKEDAENAERVEKAYTRVSTAVKNAFMAIGAAILPHANTIDKFASQLTDAIRGVKEFIDENRAWVIGIAAVGGSIAAAGALLVGLGLALSVAGVAIGGLMAGLEAVVAIGGAMAGALALLFSPAGLAVAAGVVAAIAGLGVLLEQFPNEFADIAETASRAWGTMADVFASSWGGIKKAIAAGDLKLAFQIAVDTLDVAWKAFLMGLTLAWNEFKNVFVDGWTDVMTEIKVQLSAALNWMKKEIVDQLGESGAAKVFGIAATVLPGISALAGKITGGGATLGMTEEEIRAAGEKAKADAHAARNTDALAAAADLAAAEMKRREDVAKANALEDDKAKKKKKAVEGAVEGLTVAKGQFGGYGLGGALGVSGEAIQKKQLEQLEEINGNTKDLGGVRAF